LQYKNLQLCSSCLPLASTYAHIQSLAPFTLVKIVPSLHDSLTKIFNITDLCFVYHFLHASPYLVIDGIQIWAVRGPKCRIYEARSFIREKCNRFLSSVRSVADPALSGGSKGRGGKSGHGPPIELGNGVWPPSGTGRKSNDSIVHLWKCGYGFGPLRKNNILLKHEKVDD